jgi:hypothetical protein
MNYYFQNRDKLLNYQKNYYKENRDRYLIYNKEYYKRNLYTINSKKLIRDKEYNKINKIQFKIIHEKVILYFN